MYVEIRAWLRARRSRHRARRSDGAGHVDGGDEGFPARPEREDSMGSLGSEQGPRHERELSPRNCLRPGRRPASSDRPFGDRTFAESGHAQQLHPTSAASLLRCHHGRPGPCTKCGWARVFSSERIDHPVAEDHAPPRRQHGPRLHPVPDHLVVVPALQSAAPRCRAGPRSRPSGRNGVCPGAHGPAWR